MCQTENVFPDQAWFVTILLTSSAAVTYCRGVFFFLPRLFLVTTPKTKSAAHWQTLIKPCKTGTLDWVYFPFSKRDRWFQLLTNVGELLFILGRCKHVGIKFSFCNWSFHITNNEMSLNSCFACSCMLSYNVVIREIWKHPTCTSNELNVHNMKCKHHENIMKKDNCM